MDINSIIIAVIIVGVTGLIFGVLLAVASIVFAVKTDEREELIVNELPGANCGACGYAGCSAFASAVVGGEAPVNGCSVGKDRVAEKIAQIMGVKAEKTEPVTARVMCVGDCTHAENKYEYSGIEDCAQAARLAGGAKTCPNGCLGLGTCAKACPFDAIKIENSIAVIDEEKCRACGICVAKCPKNIIKMVPKKNKVAILCSNTEKGALANKYCTVSCIGCKICEKTCPVGAVKVEDNLASIDYSLCTNCGLCAEKCPRKIIFNRGA